MYDLIVIGGGPAGACASQCAAALGLKVLLFEKDKFPRYKPCGGALSEQALSYIGGIPDNLVENEIYGVRVKYKNETVEVLKNQRVATLTSRDLFDNYLLESAKVAGAEVRIERVTHFSEEEDYIKVTTKQGESLARFLIIAEGAHGNLKYKIRSRDNNMQRGTCLVTEVPFTGHKAKLSKEMLEIEFGITHMGYGWVFPHKDFYSVGIGGISSQLKKNAKKKFNDYLASNELSSGSSAPKGHLIPFGGLKRKLTGKRTLLCGDAGGFVDTLMGEGIAYAIRSGQIAAEHIGDMVENNYKADMKFYEKACRKEFNDNLKYSFILSKCIHSYPDLFLRIFTRNTKILDKVLDVSIMKTTYKKLLLFIVIQMILTAPLMVLDILKANIQLSTSGKSIDKT